MEDQRIRPAPDDAVVRRPGGALASVHEAHDGLELPLALARLARADRLGHRQRADAARAAHRLDLLGRLDPAHLAQDRRAVAYVDLELLPQVLLERVLAVRATVERIALDQLVVRTRAIDAARQRDPRRLRDPNDLRFG